MSDYERCLVKWKCLLVGGFHTVSTCNLKFCNIIKHHMLMHVLLHFTSDV